MRRLYIGGLSHSVTEKDLKDRFGKFGDVQDVEIRTRRDDEGIPYKTFGYININISEPDLKKCLTVLNKSKWKGGTLQIETAKESFLNRLAQERQAAVEQKPAAEDKRQKLLDSLSTAGVDNFIMKAAVPGTEVPGHKDWVVSKFGRVLPILQLKCQKGNRARTLKYDPSKYSHNIRKLDRTTTDQPVTPVTQLTWEVQGGDDDISKKRRGEFPPYEPSRPKKSRSDRINSHNPVGKTRFDQTAQPLKHIEAHQLTNGFEPNYSPAQRRRAQLNDVDSDEEIRRLVAAQQTSHGALRQELEDDNLEVVGLDYLAKTGKIGRPDAEDEVDYDSADTDELFASRNPPPPPPKEKLTPTSAERLSGNKANEKGKTKKKSKAEEQREENYSAQAEEHSMSRTPSSTQQRGETQKKSISSENQSQKRKVLPFSEPDDDDEEDEYLESADSCSDSDYDAMFSNVIHLEISLADLQRLAEESQQTSETKAPNILSTDPKQDANLTSGPAEQRAPRKGILPEEILAAIMEENSSEDEQKKKKRKGVKSAPLPAFTGTRVLNEGSGTDQCLKRQKEGRSVVTKQMLESEALKLSLSREKCKETKKIPESSEEDEEEEEEHRKEEVVKKIAPTKVLVPTKVPVSTVKAETGSSSSSDEEEERIKARQTVHTAKAAAKASASSSSSSSEEDDEKQEIISADDAVKAAPPPAPDSESLSSSGEEEQAPPQVSLRPEDEEERQRKANMRRLAAVQQRQKEAEEHKRLIQGALASLDTPKALAGKHVVFGSDDDDDDEDEQQTNSQVSTLKKTLFHDSQSEDESTDGEASATETVRPKPSGSQLFDDGDEEEDGGRFDIRPQFEGRAGQKLMELQSRFGTDERFRMDSRFLEGDEKDEEESERKRSLTEEDEALEEERKKNLEILQSILGSGSQTCSKTASKAKTFRDVSVLHYDPSREEHAVFETKTEETKKESKSVRRKKREEAQTLPEVSKEIYYEVSGDLKAVFGPTKSDLTEGEEKTSWDQEEEVEEGGKDEEPTMLPSLFSADPSADKDESTGFKFSFFGDETETQSKESAEYKVESIQAPKVSWQQDPRFHDSSSEEDEDEQGEDEEQTRGATKTTEEEVPSKMDLFFFYPEDRRLTEGPRLFCRSTQLEEQREQWEERRNALRQEYRKKHKDARRKLKSSQKS